MDPSGSARIFKWTDVTQQACADLTASTKGASYWSYSSSMRHCWVKKTYQEKTEKSGTVSGSADCGVRGIRGKGRRKKPRFFED